MFHLWNLTKYFRGLFAKSWILFCWRGAPAAGSGPSGCGPGWLRSGAAWPRPSWPNPSGHLRPAAAGPPAEGVLQKLWVLQSPCNTAPYSKERAVSKFISGGLLFAPSDSFRVPTSPQSSLAASCRAVRPQGSVWLMSAAARSSSCRMALGFRA